MIAGLNLSSNPFRNRALPWVVAVAVACVSLVALFFTLAEYRQVRLQADAGERDLRGLREERRALEAQASEVREALPADQRQTLAAAHALVDRKSFSWSQLFADLEASLPAGVRVSRISVRDVTHQGEQTRADLELAVVGRTPADVTDMIRDMSRVGAFSAFPVSESEKTGKGESGYEWVLRVSYLQRGRSGGGGDDGEGDRAASVAPSSDAVASAREQ